MKTAHTPGPWIQAGPSHGDRLPRFTDEIVTDHDDDGDSPQTICVFNGCLDDENEANAALIAAAPDLLEALKRLVDIEDGVGLGAVWAISPLDFARAAIKKATGENK